MKTAKINGKTLKISAPQERSLRHLAANDYDAKQSDFTTKRGRWMSFELTVAPEFGTYERARYELKSGKLPRRVVKFFDDHPRCERAIVGNPRRINAILAQLERN